MGDLADNESVEIDYGHGVRVIRADRGEQRPIWRFDAPDYKPKQYDTTPEWENKQEAVLYAAVYTAVNGFREEKTGRRGIPPAVQRYGQEAVISYLSTQDGISTKWLTRYYDLDRQRIYEYRSRIKSAAEMVAEEAEEVQS